MSGRWGGRSSGQAGSRDFRHQARDENDSEKRHREDARTGSFNGKQGTGRPPHEMSEHASGMSDKYVRGYDACSIRGMDGSRFELRYIAVEAQPWHVVDSDVGVDPEKAPGEKVKKFNTQEEAERYILDQNRKAWEDESDNRSELQYRKAPAKA